MSHARYSGLTLVELTDCTQSLTLNLLIKLSNKHSLTSLTQLHLTYMGFYRNPKLKSGRWQNETNEHTHSACVTFGGDQRARGSTRRTDRSFLCVGRDKHTLVRPEGQKVPS
jgi:hypothetical protein